MASKTEDKYTLLESGVVFGLAIPALALTVMAFLPLYVLEAWLRSMMWSWFAVPYLHLPVITLWPMLGLDLLISSFQIKYPSLKKDLYESGFVSRVGYAILVELMTFGLSWALHRWILKG